MKFKKFSLVLLSALIVVTSFGGCGKKEESLSATTEQTNQSTDKKESTEEKSKKEARTITMLGSLGTNADFEKRDQQASWQAAEKMFEAADLNIEFELVANEQYKQVLQTRLASAKDLPDIVNSGHLDELTRLNMGKRGIFLDIIPLIDEYSDGSIRKLSEEYFPEMFPGIETEEGKAYWFPKQQIMTYKGEPFYSNLTMLIRQDWLDKVGIEKPDTLEEYYQALVAFQAKDVNENGQADEKILYTPSFGYIAPSFGLPSGTVTVDSYDNKVKSPWLMKEELIEFVEYVKRLVDANLIDLDALDKGGDVTTQKIQANEIASVATYALGTWNDALVKPYGGIYVPMMLGKEEGHIPRTHAEPSYMQFGASSITKNAKDLQAIMDFYDLIYTKEFADLMFYGVEGVTHTVEDGIKIFHPNFKDKDFYTHSATGVYLWGETGIPNNQISCQEAYMGGLKATRPDLEEFSDEYCIGQEYWFGGQLALPTEDEANRLKKIKTDIDTYSSETLVKLCLGQYEINDIDTYINTLMGMGLQEYIDIYQARHDRYIETMNGK